MPNYAFDPTGSLPQEAAQYLLRELSTSNFFLLSPEAAELKAGFLQYLKNKKAVPLFEKALARLSDQPIARFQLSCQWLQAYIQASPSPEAEEVLMEVAAGFVVGELGAQQAAEGVNKIVLEGKL